MKTGKCLFVVKQLTKLVLGWPAVMQTCISGRKLGEAARAEVQPKTQQVAQQTPCCTYIGSKREKEPGGLLTPPRLSPVPHFKPGAGSAVAGQDRQAAAWLRTMGDNRSLDPLGQAWGRL